MWLAALGVLTVVLKLSGHTVVAHWAWWAVLAPFALAALWWTYCDLAGKTQRDAVRRHAAKVRRRRKFHLDALGMTARDGADSKPPSSRYDDADRYRR